MDALGYTAAFFATGSFIPQVLKTWRTRSAEDLSWLMLATHVLGLTLWLLYGIALRSSPIIAANAIGVALDILLIALKLRTPD